MGYDNWLQTYLDNNQYPYDQYYTAKIKMLDTLSRISNLPLVFMVQTHVWNTPYAKLREPINEEIKLMINLSLTSGAKGMLYFWYG